ncbi:MAG TPA: hypothetical protein VH877_08325 [Polyangia bacterium]|jgi:ElaB/YqjD/DUF883 family membrane-anchored ribosome-binding protein|nr:hypothetical protein [Polyangia bacterium]
MEPKPPSAPKSTGKTNGNGNGSRAEASMHGAHAAEAQEFVNEGLERMRASTEEMGERVMTFIRERPMTSVLIALAAGVMVGRLLRA